MKIGDDERVFGRPVERAGIICAERLAADRDRLVIEFAGV
jgi:hypothetical protein